MNNKKSIDYISDITSHLMEIEHTYDVSSLPTVCKSLGYFKDAIQRQEKVKNLPFNIHPQVAKLMEIPQYEQRSPEWFEQRRHKLTSSDLDAVLGNNKYSSEEEVLFKKCGLAKPFTGNEATQHGQKYEDEAIALYCKKYNKVNFSFGLLPHPTIPFIGGSPDDITADGIVIEVKCPLRRRIKMGEVPLHYQSQIKMNMEIAGLTKGVFIEYKPASMCQDNNYILNVVEFERDPMWIKKVYPKLESFWNSVEKYKEIGIETHPKYQKYYRIAHPEPKKLDLDKECNHNPHGHGFDSDSDDE